MTDALWRIALRAAYRVLRLWWAVRRPETHGAWVAVWRDESLLLIRSSYRRGECTPAGAISRRETPIAAAARELFEEVGIEAAPERLRPAGVHTQRFECRLDHAHFFELDAGPEVVVRIDRREVVHAEFVPRDELDGRPLLPHVRSYLASRASQGSSSASRDADA